ncbi:pyridoxal phosphate enzyme, YggS family [Limihaloglobus sulfuriphilus]|uniref:Pyridoxal phosphate homeostasis protein n=1 Tax=Limihaloglobus sulfuriphilus TaxID=1851148 RepID=A0A1Q2MAS2_9BACT|nr:YggS family pyridoxal phosphate-dependent enzyme [Limihaloglobus sulfuriphilus]AQQ69825.1 pyridoxal phosphate enzyme, YggS family [Limihaloglobus sulfuriphilus]
MAARTIKDNLKRIEENINTACGKSGRSRDEITLIAVTKTVGIQEIIEVIAAGYTELGENRLPHLEEVATLTAEYIENNQPETKVNWHMIGHLQRNKVRKLLPISQTIHSVDSLRLAAEINSTAQKYNITAEIFLQANCSGEQQKYGIEPAETVELAGQIGEMPNIKLAGVMTMAAFTDNEAQIRKTFIRAREIFEQIRGSGISPETCKYLSMGMTNDYTIAVEEGATHLRIGSAIFN